MDPQLEYVTKRIVELENRLLVNVEETVCPAEVGMVYSQIENAGYYPAHQLPLFARDHSPGMLANTKSKCQENKSRPALNPFRHYEHRHSYAC